jgi:hypothetical protein
MDSIELQNSIQTLEVPPLHNAQGAESSTSSLPKPGENQVTTDVSDGCETPNDGDQQGFEVVDDPGHGANQQPTALM